MFVGEKQCVQEGCAPTMRRRFDISEQHVDVDGKSFQFLRRTHEKVETGLRIFPRKYVEPMVGAYKAKLGEAKVQKLPRGEEILESDGAKVLGYELAGFHRSLVGSGIYLSILIPSSS